ncbi:MAG: glycerol-3-phosphate acyltransferase [Bacteroidales bacterium]|jgi:glycerol-3-phosphate acyltransferase PlsY|nr:glycerol-3-phosphate acyltransferase [Bacteroidales bacterium]
MNQYVLYLVCLVAGYLIGSVLFAELITKLVSNQNIRELGNGNPGAYNVFRNVGKFWGVLTGLLDAVKALVPMWIAYQFFHITDTTALGCIGIGAVIGHGYPLYYHFKGGRAASTLLGMYAYFIGIELLIALAVDVIVLFGFIKKEYGIWGPSILIALSGILCLFFPHELGVKILVWIGALITLFFNRDKLTEKKEKVPKKLSQQQS